MLEDKRLDKDVPIPLYFQLEKLILEEIDNGNYPVGSMIPTEMELSQMFGISRTTVRQAISDLVREEHLYRIKSKGTFVAHPKLVQGFIQSIQSFDDDVRSTGRTPSTEVLDLKLVELEPEEAAEMLHDNGQEESGLDKLARVGFDTLGLQTYLTAGEKESRAWTIRKGATAPQAAGVIHTDFERGFIKAEIVSYDDLVQYGSVAEARAHGRVRMEGKDYVLADGDVVEFRFNV